jgi:hypothetical protein
MPTWLRPWIEQAEGPIVAWRGKPIAKVAGAFQTMRDTAGFASDVTAYTVRHSIATELGACGVPELEIAMLLGHRVPNSRTTGRYIQVAPERLASARKALDDMANDIGRVAGRPMFPTTPRSSCVAVPHLSATTPAGKPLKSGAAVGTGIQLSLGFPTMGAAGPSMLLNSL